MKLWRLPGLFLLRTIARELGGIRHHLLVQNAILVRLADQLAPIPIEHDPAVVRAESGVDFADDHDQFLMQEFAARVFTDTGHLPTDEEVLIYLADEKTRDLHQRLKDREIEVDRLGGMRG